jgi:peptide/nickel transport system substrate-binding protein
MQVWHTDGWANHGSNFFGFGNAETDSLIENIRTVMDAEERRPLYYKFQEIFAEEVPMIVVMSPTERIMIHKRFKNAKGYSSRPGYKVAEFWTPKENQLLQ